jgi:hypothetical protein
VADLGIAHLPVRQADVAALGVDQGAGAIADQGPPVRQVGLGDGVVGRVVPVPPAIQDQQQQGLGAGGHRRGIPDVQHGQL